MIRRATPDELPTLLEIRRIVFIDGQNVPVDIERDGLDGEALQYIAFKGEVPVGTARALVSDGTGKIGRVAVLKEHRRQGIGKRLMQAVLDDLRGEGLHTAKLGAQTHALAFYEALGFQAYGPEFLDADIPHRSMSISL